MTNEQTRMNSTISTSESDKDIWIKQLVEAGLPLIPLRPGTKRAAIEQWQHTKPDPTQGPEQFPDNYGINILSTWLVLDIDPKSYTDGDDAWLRFKTDLKLSKKDLDTYIVRSRTYADGRKGLHIYFKIPAGYNITPNRKAYTGVQGLSSGHYVVGPGSIHPDTGLPYTVINGSPATAKFAPQRVIDMFTKDFNITGNGMESFTDDDKTRKRFISYLATAPVAIERQNGDETTVAVARVGRDFNLPEQATFDLMLGLWNPNCLPPWGEKSLQIKVANAYKYAKDEPGNLHPAAAFTVIETPPDEQEKRARALQQEKQDRKFADRKVGLNWRIKGEWDPRSMEEPPLTNALINVVNLFRRPHHGTYKSPFYKLVRYNMFTETLEFTRRAPWHRQGEVHREWSDTDTTMFLTWLSDHRSWEIPEGLAINGVIAAGQLYKYHPIKEYYATLKWDGIPRIHQLLPHYAGAEDNAYTRDVSKCTMVAAVARIMEPGCKHDHLLILEGEQGSGKSTFCKILGGDYYSQIHLDPHKKDTIVGMLGKHVIELPEMTYNKKSDADSLKMFMSKDSDRERLPYGRLAKDFKRQCIFIATTNEYHGYLRDQTGNRRKWVIRTNKFRLNEFKRDRDQLYAEALYMWRSGEPHYLTDPEVIELAKQEQAARAEIDIWTENIENWLDKEKVQNKYYSKLTTTEIASEILNIQPSQIDRYIVTRIANSMRSLGWDRIKIRSKGSSVNGYKNPHYDREMDEYVSGI